MLSYSLALDWLKDNNLIPDFDVMRLIYREPDSPKKRGLVVRPSGGSVPGETQYNVIASLFFISAQNDNLEEFSSIVNNVVTQSLCNYSYKGYNLLCTTGLTQPTLTSDGRAVFEIMIRIE